MKMMILKVMSTMSFLILVTSYIFIFFSNHPLIIGMMVILQAGIYAFIMSLKFKFSWFSFMIFMIYLGGILMLFSYIISITFSEEKILKKSKKSFFLMTVFAILMPFFFFTKKESLLLINKMKINFILSASFSSSWKISMFMLILF
nr:NADH dehydrogenase subunit 6 [Scirtothrips hansoni]